MRPAVLSPQQAESGKPRCARIVNGGGHGTLAHQALRACPGTWRTGMPALPGRAMGIPWQVCRTPPSRSQGLLAWCGRGPVEDLVEAFDRFLDRVALAGPSSASRVRDAQRGAVRSEALAHAGKTRRPMVAALGAVFARGTAEAARRQWRPLGQPAIQSCVVDSASQGEPVVLPLPLDCPVQSPAGGRFTRTFAVKAGDECLVVFASRCIDACGLSGGVRNQSVLRMHDLSDGFTLPGLPRCRPSAACLHLFRFRVYRVKSRYTICS